ncbi:hypothetical protein [uncultured Adlercreutzia sp.]|uniref:hypothetical protein n=1 Tax=uncultured Adlercreutzia sp. TaxID=875803 RepID=UPI00272EE436|nr:hypothetical protein [uncultured Adlercreutzia sp.]
MNTWSRRLVSLVCAFTLACSLTSTLAWGAEASGEETTGDLDSTSGVSPIVEIGTLATATADIEPLALDPEGYTALKPGNHVRWIDRLDVPDYALEFYKVLEEAVDNDGYRDFLIDDKYYNGAIEEEGAYYARSDSSGINPVLIFLKVKDDAVAEHPAAESFAYIRDVYAAFQRDHPEVFLAKQQLRIRSVLPRWLLLQRPNA